MRKVYAIAAALVVALAAGSLLAEEAKKAPGPVVFEAKPGNVTFDHAKHLEAVKGDCKACHDAVFAQAKADLTEYKAGMHKKAEADKKLCGACHRPEGTAFESKGNCTKCHVKK